MPTPAPAPGLWPRTCCRPTTSKAEEKVYDALAADLPKGWHAWHSLRIRDRRNLDGEGDFVLAVPDRGVLVLEVKGGRMEARDGHWFQNGHRLKKAPREQAVGFSHRLAGLLRDKAAAPPAFGAATCFPDTPFDAPPTAADLEGCVLGAQDLPYIGEALPSLAARALPDPRPSKPNWIATLHALWGETWTPRLRLGQQARLDEAERLRLVEEQLMVLDMANANDRLLVHGGAGTGKTILAIEAARRQALAGRRVLLLCFTEALARWMAAAFTDIPAPGEVTVTTVRKLAFDLLREADLITHKPRDSESWEQVPWRAAEEALPKTERSWDTLVIDEGQDFSLGDWGLVEALATDRRLWAFHDTAQGFWDDRAVFDGLFTARIDLTRAYRCPAPLLAVARGYLGQANEVDDEALRAAVDDGHLAAVPCPSESSVPDKVARELDKLRGEGLAPQDIAVISLRGLTAPDAITRKPRLGRHELVPADHPDIESRVVADTFLRFKGLERPAVVITDLRLVQDRRDIRMYIAMTRAMLTARVVAPREVLGAGPILSRLLER